VLGNKIDLRGAVSDTELMDSLGIYHTTGKGKVQLEEHIRPIEVFMCSIANGQGYAEGMYITTILTINECTHPGTPNRFSLGSAVCQRKVKAFYVFCKVIIDSKSFSIIKVDAQRPLQALDQLFGRRNPQTRPFSAVSH